MSVYPVTGVVGKAKDGYSNCCMENRDVLQQSPYVPSRRLDDRIRELCGRAITADDDDLVAVLSELQSALQEHAGQMGAMAVRHADRQAKPWLTVAKPVRE